MSETWNFRTNVFASLKSIESIQDEKEKQHVATEFANNVIAEYSRDVGFIANRFEEVGYDVEALSIPRNLMDSLKEAIFSYVNGLYRSTIATVGIVAELFCVHIYKIYLQSIGLDPVKVNRRTAKFNEIRQAEKIDTLFSIVGESEEMCSILHEIRDIRNMNVHPNSTNDFKEDALDCLQKIIYVINKYSEKIKQSTSQALPTAEIDILVPIIKAEDILIGDKDAPVSFYGFLDYQCPYSRKFWTEVMPKIREEYIDKKKVKFVVKNFPLETMYPMAYSIASFLLCVNQKFGNEAYIKMMNLVYEKQNILDSGNANGPVTRVVDLNLKDVADWANSLGYNVDDCLNSQDSAIANRRRIDSEIKDAQLAGATGTPYFLIEFRPIAGAYSYETFKAVLDEELAKH